MTLTTRRTVTRLLALNLTSKGRQLASGPFGVTGKCAQKRSACCQRLFLLPLLFLLPFLLGSCLGEEDYTTSPNDIFAFSTDTVRFDTIISGSPTNTYTFTVYNRNKKAIRIPTVSLDGGAASPFKVNVDGTTLTDGAASDFEISGEDSLIVYLMANVPETDTDEPVDYADNLAFQTEGGMVQKVALRASGQSVITLTGLTISADQTWQARRPYRIIDSLVVAEGATLTLAAGTRLYFHPSASLIVRGTLRSEGTLDNPVEIRGDRLGNMFAGQPYDRIPGQWGGITFASSSYDNYINFTDIHSGTYGLRVDSSDVSRRTLTVENSIIHNPTYHGLDVRMAQVYVGNTQITNSGGDCVRVRGGNAEFVHCTLGRFFVFSGGSGYALTFANHDGDIPLPLSRLAFSNCIITGYQSDELMGNQSERFTDTDFNYTFRNCLINTPDPEDDGTHFVNCQWDNDDASTGGSDSVIREENFTPAFDLDALTFSFRLSDKSKATGTADASVTAQTYPADRLGQTRGAAPDMGCYQHVETDGEEKE